MTAHPLRRRNSATGTKDPFVPRDWRGALPEEDRRVRMYVCGPTVYDRAHIGNARPAVVFDVLFRLLRHLYDDRVIYVRNLTDVEDKINDRAAERWPEMEPLAAIARLTAATTDWYHEDMDALGVYREREQRTDPARRPRMEEPRATLHIEHMLDMIKSLVATGHAYEAEGHVLFDVQSYAAYGALSGRDTEDMIAGARVEVAPYKKHPMDFVLWKPSSETQPGWESPWGRGRPGWHIECSAMSKALLGEDFDIHGGGADLLFPHHENEVAQSCCASPGHRFAEVWLHNGMIRVDGRKMSKSLGNFFTVHDKLAEKSEALGDPKKLGMSGDLIRYILLNAHYRDELDWTEAVIDQARAGMNRLNRLNDRFRRARLIPTENPQPHPDVLERLCDDLDTYGALQALQKLAGAALSPPETSESALREVLDTARFLGFRLGLSTGPDASVSIEAALDAVDAQDAVIESACRRLDEARAARDFAAADALRAKMQEAGLVVQTGKGGTTAERGADFDRTRLEALK